MARLDPSKASRFKAPVLVAISGTLVIALVWFLGLQAEIQTILLVLLSLFASFLAFGYLRQRKSLQNLRTQTNDVQEALQEWRTNLDFALDSGSIGLYRWDVTTGELIWNNQHFIIFGFVPFEIEPTYEAFRSRVHPDDIEALEAKLEQAKRSKQDYINEFRVILPNNETRFVKGRGRWTYDKHGNAKTIVGIVIDNTAARIKHRELEEKRRQLNMLLENVPAVIARMDLSLKHLYVNEQVRHVTGLEPDAFIGKTNEEMGVPPELCEHWRKESLLVIDTGKSRKITFPFLDQNNSTRYFEAHIVPELKDDQTVQSLLFITHDITDLVNSKTALEKQEQALRQANLRKNDFLAELAHELRNIISPLSNTIELLGLKAAGNPQDQHINKIMQRQIDILIRMTNDLMDSTKIARGKIELVKSSESLRSILESAIDLASPELKARGHSLTATLPIETLKIDCDSVRLTQVFTNIINNAAKYTPESGNIEITSEVDDQYVSISVKDDGIGISKETKDQIFELFEQGGRDEEKHFSGLGVGLSIVKSLVEQHKGNVEVLSDGPNKGSTFKVKLPLSESLALH